MLKSTIKKPMTADDIQAPPIYPIPEIKTRTGPFLAAKISTRYDYASIADPGVAFPQDDPKSRSMTNQSDKDSTDINLIMKKYEQSGFITDAITGEQRKPVFGDFTNVGDYHEISNKIAKANEAFDVLPAEVRNRFKNDPALLINFLANPANDAEAVKLGLKEKPPEGPRPPYEPPKDPAAPGAPAGPGNGPANS